MSGFRIVAPVETNRRVGEVVLDERERAAAERRHLRQRVIRAARSGSRQLELPARVGLRLVLVVVASSGTKVINAAAGADRQLVLAGRQRPAIDIAGRYR